MIHLEVLVEEPSAEAALELLLPRLVPAVTFRIHAHRGKKDLLEKLPGRLRAYASFVKEQPELRVAVLVDRDRDPCSTLKKTLEDHARAAGLPTSTRPRKGKFLVLHRIAIEELEAWFFGDVPALCAAYPGVPATLARRAAFRDPDAIPNTWERLEDVLQKAGHHLGGLGKIGAARDIAGRMDVRANASASFRAFADGVQRLCG